MFYFKILTDMLKRLLLSTILLLAVIAVMGQSVTIDKIKYEVISPTEAVLVDGYKAEGDVVVPEYVTIKDRQYRVIKIGDYAFKKQKKLDSKAENTNIKSIRLPNSIITIGLMLVHLVIVFLLLKLRYQTVLQA